MKDKNAEDNSVLFTSFRAGVIALVFLVIGFQLALFVYKGAELRILAHRDSPDTVYVYSPPSDASSGRDSGTSLGTFPGSNSSISTGSNSSISTGSNSGTSFGRPPSGSTGQTGLRTERRNSTHSPLAERIREEKPRRRIETFRFNPNTVSVEELQRLGFSPKQAASIDNYRQKGGRFRRKEDFAKSYVVADSVYRRLEAYIDIPLLDINSADSAAFDALPGIGGYFAAKMVSYRQQLGGYSCKEQLMEIYHFDRERFAALQDLVCVGPAPAFRLWTLPADSLRLHPHIRSWQTAKAIVLYREHNAKENLTVSGLLEAGILSAEQAAGLGRCRIEPPQ